jgi:hypothetical protein
VSGWKSFSGLVQTRCDVAYGTLLPWRDVGYLVANKVQADVPAEQRMRREPTMRM